MRFVALLLGLMLAACGGPTNATSPARTARALFQARTSGDRRAALRVATPAAVRSLFALNGAPGRAKFGHCSKAGVGYSCDFYFDECGDLVMLLDRTARGFRVHEVLEVGGGCESE